MPKKMKIYSTTTTTTYPTISTININTIPITSKAKYSLFGKEFEVNGYPDINVAMCLSLITINGPEIYYEFIKNGLKFSKEIDEVIKSEIRNRSIEKIINSNDNIQSNY